MGKLTTHVLDTMHGAPAAGMVVELFLFSESEQEYKLINRIITNSMGRADKPILDEKNFAIGQWQLLFHVADYFAQFKLDKQAPPFLNKVPIHFGIAALDEHYHVPLLVTPWSYSTYRGS